MYNFFNRGYHNIYISNNKEKYAMKYNGFEWELTDARTLIDDIYESKRDVIEENLEEFYNSLSNGHIMALKRWLETDKNDSGNNKKIKEIKNEIRILLYNKRKMAKPPP